MPLEKQTEILTDHKNLQCFTTKRTLTERPIRWKSFLDSLPDIKSRYRSGKEANRPDALSRLEQDTPTDQNDHRLQYRKKSSLNQIGLPVQNALTKIR